MSRRNNGNTVSAMLKVMTPLGGNHTSLDPEARQRRLLADLCRLIGEHLNGHANGLGRKISPNLDGLIPSANGNGLHATAGIAAPEDDGLSPRMRQTLQSLLKGDSEKQAAAKLGVSQHTVHVYVKKLYRKFDVCSRGELLAKWVR